MVRTAAVIAAVMVVLMPVTLPEPTEPVKPDLEELEYLGEFTCTAYV